jgi:uncharacterized protein with GYD domain
MQPYLYQISYTPDAWSKQLKNPVNRLEIVKPVIEKAGGKIVCGYYAFGPTDLFVIIEAPDNQSAAALSLAFASGGALSKCEITPLMGTEEGLGAIKQGGELVGLYKPPA